MSGSQPPGWFADPTGRHVHRWWDGTAWTDQVADGGVASSDPVAVGASGAVEPDAPGGRKVPVGVVALLAVVVVGLVAAAVVLATRSGDDDDDAAAPDTSSVETGARSESFEGTLDDGDPALVVPIDLEAGAPVRVVVTSDDVDVALQLAVEPDALEAFRGLIAPGGEPALVEERLTRQAAVLWYAVDDGVSDIFVDDEDLDSLTNGLDTFVPEVVAAGPLFLGTDRTSSGDPEGIQFVAPVSGRYALVVSGGDGDVEGAYEVGEPAGDVPDPEDPGYLDYLSLYGEHTDFLCDEGFFGADPAEVTNYGSTVCDGDTLDGVLAGELNGDFTNDFGGGEAPVDGPFSDDLTADPGGAGLGEPVPPGEFIREYGTDAGFDALADQCFAGDLAACDELYLTTPIEDSVNTYEGYGATCGGRRAEEDPGRCA